ncbi:MAG: PQQ-binding-like beta-propeller repeat protein [candidate division WOR-3 bacterium]|nr:PQQ-binding-like beta-propeller repeat protein [candidate division WOR-3 bacterium]MCX7757207.1 PQQ-binding-like beta-propeller repeat protein [candidate division WOR-3 bacterium]
MRNCGYLVGLFLVLGTLRLLWSISFFAPLIGDTTRPVEFSIELTNLRDSVLSYQLDWGDGTLSEWKTVSGNYLFANYLYSRPGIYYPKIRFKEINNNITDWTSSCTIQIIPSIVKWIFKTNSGIYSPVAIGKNNELYCTTEDGILYCILPTGDVKWQLSLKAPLYPAPVIGNSLLYIVSTSGVVYGIDFSGKIIWTYEIPSSIYSSIALTSKENLVFGCDDGNLYCLSNNGKYLWKFSTGDEIAGSPVIDENDIIYCASDAIYAIDSKGRQVWKFSPPEEDDAYFFGSPSIGPDGTIYLGATNGFIYAITKKGRLKWKIPTPEEDAIRTAIVIDRNNTLYVGDEGGIFYIKRQGEEIKQLYETDYYIFGSGAIDSLGNIYFVSDDGYLYALRSDGKLLYKWQIAEDSKELMYSPSPIIADDGTIYIGSWEGQLYALNGFAPAMSGCWSQVRSNKRNTAKIIKNQVIK